MTQEQIIQGIRDGNMRVFERFYDSYRQQFVSFMMKRQGVKNVEHAEDLYRMSCAHLHANIRAGKYEVDLTRASLKTYLNSIGKYILYGERKKKSPPLVFDWNVVLEEEAYDAFYSEDHSTQEQLFILRKTVEGMPQPCAHLLHLRIYRCEKSKKIAQEMGYQDEYSVNTQVNKCKKKLLDEVRKRFNEYGYEC